MNTMNREAWLELAIAKLRSELFAPQGHDFPEGIRVSVGFGFGRSKSSLSILGQYWPKGLASDGVPQVFITPALDDSARVLDVLVHELCHAVAPEAGHGKVFKRIALSVGLTGKMRATVAGPELTERLNKLVTEIGPIPHAALTPGQKVAGAPKKQTTRLIPVECSACGYKARTTRTWLDSIGAPLCACNSKPMFVGGE